MKVAVVGVGRWGVNHVRVLSQLKQEGYAFGTEAIEELVVVDKDWARARSVASRYRADAFFSDLAEALAYGVEAVVVAVPTIYHCDVALKALEKAHVLVEKPIASSVEEAAKLIKKAEREGRVLAVGHIERFNPAVSMLQEELSRVNDHIVYVRGERVGPGPPSRSAENLGVAHDLLIHDVDISLMLIGDMPREVQAITIGTRDFPYEVEITSIFTFNDGVVANLRASWRSEANFKRRVLEVQTTKKTLAIDYIACYLRVEEGLAVHRNLGNFLELVAAYQSRRVYEVRAVRRGLEPLRAELINFLESAAKGSKPAVTGVDGLRALLCVVSALNAAKRGRRVEVPRVEDVLR